MCAFSHNRAPLPRGTKTFLGVVPCHQIPSITAYSSYAGSLFLHRAFVGFAIAFIEQVKGRETLGDVMKGLE